jgi:DNA-binding GntR family transcriptional regulator
MTPAPSRSRGALRFALTQKIPGRPAMEIEPCETVLGWILARRGEAASDAMRRLLELSRLRVLTALDTRSAVAKIAG